MKNKMYLYAVLMTLLWGYSCIIAQELDHAKLSHKIYGERVAPKIYPGAN